MINNMVSKETNFPELKLLHPCNFSYLNRGARNFQELKYLQAHVDGEKIIRGTQRDGWWKDHMTGVMYNNINNLFDYE